MNDDTLRHLIKQQTLQDPGNPYFVKKVLNRLPAKPRPEPGLWILRAAYVLAALLLAVFWLRLILHGAPLSKHLPIFITLWFFTLLLSLTALRRLGRTPTP